MSRERLLARDIAPRQLTAVIFNYTVGSGIFVLPAVAAADLGPFAVLAYFVCAVVMGLVVLCFAEAGSRVSATGGPYAYVEAALGPMAGFLVGTALTVTSVTLAGLAAANIRGVKAGARVVEFFAVAKLVPMLAFIVVGPAFVEVENLYWSSLPSATRVISVTGVLIFAFVGIESALQPSGEVQNVTHTVPRAAFAAITAVTVLYIAVQLIAQGVLGVALLDDRAAPLASAAGHIFGPTGRVAMLITAAVSMLGMLSGMILASPHRAAPVVRIGQRWPGPAMVGGRSQQLRYPPCCCCGLYGNGVDPRAHRQLLAARDHHKPFGTACVFRHSRRRTRATDQRPARGLGRIPHAGRSACASGCMCGHCLPSASDHRPG